MVFSQDCTYDGKLSLLNIYYPINKKVKQHNIERKCVLMFLDKFLINLEMNNKIDSIDLLILSDHGARITKDASSYLSTIYAAKNMNTKYIENNKKISIQKLFYEKFN